MKTELRIIFFITTFLMIFGCSSSKYSYTNRRHHSFQKKYSASDSLYLEKFILYGLSFEGLKNRRINLMCDSLMGIFIHSISRIGLPIQISNEVENIDQNDCTSGTILKYKNINTTCLKESLIKQKERTTVLPIIGFSYGRSTHLNSAGSDKYPHFTIILHVAVFILKNNEIIYYKQMRHGKSIDSEFHPYKFEDFHIPIPQEHWDGLVREVMKEYMERLR